MNPYEERRRVWEQMRTLLDDPQGEGDNLSAEQAQEYERLEGRFDELTAIITREERNRERERLLNEVESDPIVNPGNQRDTDEGEDEYRRVFVQFVVRGVSGLSSEDRQILATGYRAPEGRAQSVGTDAGGGYLVPTGFRERIVETLKAYGAVREVAEVVETATGNDLPWPTVDDTANKGAILAENTQATEQDLTIGQATLGAYMYTSKIVRASLQFLQDVAWMDAEAFLARKLAERIGRIQNEHFTTGTGTAQPEGIQTNSTVGVTLGTGNTTSVTYDGLIDLVHSVDPAYRAAGADRVAFMLGNTALGTIRKLKDSQNRPLWEPAIRLGEPDTLLGYRVVVNPDMPAPAASVKSVLFGDFRAGYVIRDVTDFRLLRLDERYADFLQVGFIGFQRSDALQQDDAAYKALQHSAT